MAAKYLTPCVHPALLICAMLVCGCNDKSESESPTPVKSEWRDMGTPHKEARPSDETAKPVSLITEMTLRDSAMRGEIEIVRQAIKQGVEVDAIDEKGRTALLLASCDGHTDVVQLLLESDAHINHRNFDGSTALMFAASGANHETVRMLLKAGADADVVDKGEGFTALMYAAAEGQAEVVRVLLRHDADVTVRDKDGDTAADFAKQNGHIEVTRLLEAR